MTASHRDTLDDHLARRFAATLLLVTTLAVTAHATLTRTHAAAPPRRDLFQRVDINAATADQLRLLPTIGPARAAAIIADRAQHGPFETLEDLDRVPGIGPRTIDALAPFMAFN